MTSARPLAGVTVLEIAHSVAGPYAGYVLAGLGADVVKLEPPGGDAARRWGPPFAGDDAIAFAAVNRDKRSVTIDLTEPDGRERACAFIRARVDIVLQNQKLGALARLGLDLDNLRRAKPELIVCNISAYGAHGPMANRPGYDPIAQADAGLMSLMGEPNGSPVRVPVSIIDMTTGLWTALGAVAALRERDATGIGGTVDGSLYETALAMMATPLLAHLATEELPERLGSAHAMTAPSQAIRARDGWLMIAVGADAQFARLAQVLGRPELAADPRFGANANRLRHRAALIAAIEEVTVGQPAEELARALGTVGVPASTIRTLDQVAKCAQTAALGIVEGAAAEASMALPLQFDHVRSRPMRGVPPLGADTAELLASLA